MRFLFITLFPEQIEQAAGHSIIKRAVDAGLVEVSCINPRDFATDRHRTVDDTPFGGGAGMVLKPEPMVAAIRMAKQQLPAARVIAMCPGGRTLKQDIVEEYARSGQDLILVCGHYEGFDERIFNWVDEKTVHWRLCTYRRRTAGTDSYGRCSALYTGRAWKNGQCR